MFGDDHDTSDGTGVRDYIHVVDLARGHICTLEKVLVQSGQFVVNLCSANGYSMLEIVKNFELVSKKSMPYKVVDQRLGDIADPEFAKTFLGWQAEFDLARIYEDS